MVEVIRLRVRMLYKVKSLRVKEIDIVQTIKRISQMYSISQITHI
jgi:hypothetical protein